MIVAVSVKYTNVLSLKIWVAQRTLLHSVEKMLAFTQIYYDSVTSHLACLLAILCMRQNR